MRDVRVRQAYSRAIDRDLYSDTFGNISNFTSQGLPVDTAYNTALPASEFKGWWLDPQEKDFGPNAVFYKYDIAEARKLLAAAGFPNGISVISNQIGSNDYGADYAKYIEVMEGMASDAGFQFQKEIQNYSTNWMSEFRDSHGFFEGVAYRALPRTPDPGDQLYVEYNSNGSVYYGFDADGRGLMAKDGPYTGDPIANDLTGKMKVEFDQEKRMQYAQELQRHLAKMQYMFLQMGASSSFQLAWPVVRNWRVYRNTSGGDTWQRYWVDETQAPIRRS